MARLRAAAKKLKQGEVIRFAAANSAESGAESLDAEVVSKRDEGDVLLKFVVSGREARHGNRTNRPNAAAALYFQPAAR